jgi:histidine triad (HIT) family protein
LYEDEHVYAFEDVHPQAPFHALIVPKKHLATLDDFEPDDAVLAGLLMLTAKRLAAERGLPGYRVAMNVQSAGGQVVFHAHLHVLGGRPLKGSLG